LGGSLVNHKRVKAYAMPKNLCAMFFGGYGGKEPPTAALGVTDMKKTICLGDDVRSDG